MKANTKFNRLLCLLLTLVMLLGLFPIATVLAAEEESHPTAVNSFGNYDKMLGYYTSTVIEKPNSTSREVKMFAPNEIAGDTPEAKWTTLTTTYTSKNVVGWIYYIPETGTLYIKGTIPTINFKAATADQDVLKVIIAGDAAIERYILGEKLGGQYPGLKKMTIDFRNGSTLTLSKNTRSAKSAFLDITKTEGNAVRSYGDLELTGDGTLKIAPADRTPNVMFGIRANNISVLDNVSLDIKMGSRYDLMKPVSAAAITCDGKLNIDTTGTVKIDVSEKIDPSAKDERGYFKVFSNITNTTFNLTNAKSVTLKAREKNDTFVAYHDNVTGGENWHATIMDDLNRNGWTVMESAADATPYTVTMTQVAMPTAAELTVGTQTVKNTADTPVPSVTVTGGEFVSLTASVTLPAWLSDMVTGSNARAKVGDWFLRIFEGEKLVGETIGGYNNSINVNELPEVSIGTTGFKPVAGKTYTVYAGIPIVTVDGDKQLGSASVIATIKAVEKPISNVLSGSILYTSGVRYGADVTTARTGAVNSIASDKLHYQWQVKSGDAWTDISGATAGKLDADKVGTVVGKEIRLKVTADGYEGVLYSPVKTVAKAAQTGIPVAPVLTYELYTSSATVRLSNKQTGQEYLLTDGFETDEALAASNRWRDNINNSCARNLTFYVYTRMKETDTHAAGTIYRYTTVSTAEEVQLKNLTLAGYTNNTIYVKKGEPLTIDVVGTPANANKWNAVHFIEQDNTASHFTVKVDNGSTNFIPAGTGTETFGNHKITITSNTVGRHTLIAFPAETYNPYATPFGTWNVVVYEPGNITDFDIIDPPAYTDVTLAVGESYAPELTNPTLTTKPAEAMTGHTLKWFVMTPATSTGVPTYSDSNGYISVDANGKVTALAANGTVDDGYKVVALHVVDGSGRFVKSVASYKVTVNPATAPALESISVHPGTLTLKKGESADLTAIKNPVNAEGIVTWSSNTGACTVDNTGKVTAVGVGTATITATCGTKTATCTVKVICAEHTYDDTWTELDDANHYRVCTTCGEGMEIVAHSYGEQYTNDADKGQHYHECVCGHKHYEEHTPNIPAATATEGVICSKCNAELAGPLGYTTAKIVFTVTVKQGGNVAPGKQEFELEIFDYNGEPYDGLTVTAKLETNGKGDYDGELLIYGAADQVSALIGGGFFVREKDTKAANWTYSDAVWYVDMSGESAAFCPAELQITDNGNYYVYDEADPAEKLIFVNTYTENKTVKPEDPEDPKDPEKPTKPEDPKSPQTGDNSMMGLWIALLFVSGGVVTGTTLYSRKKKSEE